MLGTTLLVAVSWLLAAIFAAAVRHKIGEHARFAAALAAYRLVPAGVVGLAAKLLAAFEVVAVILLVLVMPAGLLLASGLLALYLAAMGVNIARGRAFIDCGCGDEPTPLSHGTLARNAVLIALALGVYLALPPAAGSGTMIGTLAFDQVLVAASLALVAGLIYVAVEQLLRNQTIHRRLWLGVR